jgi:chemotaxis signal transduction protein
MDEVIPLIDTAAKFNLGKITITPQTCTVILEIINEQKNSTSKVGVVVDAVSDVFETDPEQIKPLENDYKPKYISSTYKIDDTLVMILDSNKIFSEKDIIALDKIIKDLK